MADTRQLAPTPKELPAKVIIVATTNEGMHVNFMMAEAVLPVLFFLV